MKIPMLGKGSRGVMLWNKIRAVDLNGPHAAAVARITVPLLFGLWSLWLGQDRNWDQFNYHLHNAYSLLHNKLQVDLAPAGMQTYFNPVLDAGYYLLYEYLPAPVVGFLLGMLHGLDFVLLLFIAKRALPGLPAEDAYRTPLLLACAGVLTANYLSGLGNSMGDDTTSLFILASLALVLICWNRVGDWSTKAVASLMCSGVLAGLGMGLKLTNVVYAVALCCGLLTFPAKPSVRVRVAFLFGLGVLLGLAITGGYWLWEMWRTFRNPLFPQFSSIFPNPLAPFGGIGDTSWLPKSPVEAIFWPFVFAADSKRAGQVRLHQIIWPVVYVLFWAWMVTAAFRKAHRSSSNTPMNPRQAYIIAFVALGYILWTAVFSIYRYIVPIELLTPLVAYLLLTRLFSYPTAKRVAAVTLGVTTLLVVAGGFETWGHERWALRAFRADIPSLAKPEATTAVIVGGNPAWGWLTIFFPPNVAFTQIGGSFPDTPLYRERVASLVQRRGGEAYVIVEGKYNWRVDNVAKMSGVASSVGITKSDRGCAALQWTVTRLHLHASVQTLPENSQGAACRLGLRADDVRDVRPENIQLAEQARPLLDQYGFTIDPNACTLHFAYVGQGKFAYQWCPLSTHGHVDLSR
jgi:hypothetical protein